MDQLITEKMMELHSNDFINKLFVLITNLGLGYALWMISLLCILFYQIFKYKKFNISIFLGLVFLLIAYIICEFGLKNIIKRDRPYIDYPYFKLFMESLNYKLPSGYSFPSGHTVESFLGATILFIYNKKTGIVFIPFAFLVGFSRIFLGAHYFSDVIFGGIIGVIFGIIYYLLINALKKSQKIKDNKKLCA